MFLLLSPNPEVLSILAASVGGPQSSESWCRTREIHLRVASAWWSALFTLVFRVNQEWIPGLGISLG
jgi:hypothetical protein